MIRRLAPLAFALTLLACATVEPPPMPLPTPMPLRVCAVNLETWRNAHETEEPPRETSELVSKLPKVAERYGVTMIFARESLAYAAPDIDLTPKVLGDHKAPLRVGEHVGVVVMQQALAQSHVGQRARARIQEERLAKQAAVRDEEQAFRSKYDAHPDGALKQFDARELAEHKRDIEIYAAEELGDADHALRDRLVPELAELARARGLDLVYDLSSEKPALLRRGGVTIDGSIDLTADLIALQDRRFP
jgi:Skp family chaperone for outer membrane proteins